LSYPINCTSELLKEYYSEWHAGYREYKHIMLGALKEGYDRELNKALAKILMRCGSNHLDLYLDLIKRNDCLVNGVHMGVVTKAAFFLYEKNYKRFPRPVRVLIGSFNLITETLKK